MTILADGDLYQARFFMTMGVQTAIVVRHYKITGASGGETDADLAAIISTEHSTQFRNAMSSAASYRGVGVQRLLPAPKTVEVYSTLGQGAGATAGDPLPKQVSGLISLKTSFAGRSFRGRAYIPFPPEADNDSDTTPSTIYVGFLGALGVKLSSSLGVPGGVGPATATPVVFSRRLNTTTMITGHIARDAWATQRRRGDFGRANSSPI